MYDGYMDWYVYIARSSSSYLYTGISNDVAKRIDKHNAGKGAKFARMHGGLELVYTSPPMTKSEALKREYEIKSWPRTKKQQLITDN
jgi:predicted GIY-YIG superfamily endonuclease